MYWTVEKVPYVCNGHEASCEDRCREVLVTVHDSAYGGLVEEEVEALKTLVRCYADNICHGYVIVVMEHSRNDRVLYSLRNEGRECPA